MQMLQSHCGTSLSLQCFHPLMSYTGYVKAAKQRACAFLTPHAFGSLNSRWTVKVQEGGNVSFLMPLIRVSFKKEHACKTGGFSSPDGLQTYHPVVFPFFERESSRALWCLWDLIVVTVMWWKQEALDAGGKGEGRRVPLSLIVLSICQTVCSCPPLGFPLWPGSKTDAGWMDRQGRPSLQWTQTHTSHSFVLGFLFLRSRCPLTEHDIISRALVVAWLERMSFTSVDRWQAKFWLPFTDRCSAHPSRPQWFACLSSHKCYTWPSVFTPTCLPLSVSRFDCVSACLLISGSFTIPLPASNDFESGELLIMKLKLHFLNRLPSILFCFHSSNLRIGVICFFSISCIYKTF